MTKPLKVAVIGCGGFSAVHLPKLQEMDCFKLAGIADVDEGAARARAEEFGVPRWEKDHRAFLEDSDIEAFVVITPASTHAGISVDALDAGKHVFCEKPMARSVADARAMAYAASAADRVLQIGYLMRHSPDALNLCEVIQEGRIGRPVFFRDIWALSKGHPSPRIHDLELGGGIIYEHAHWLDFMTLIFGAPRKVYASTSRFKPDPTTADDTFIVIIDFDSGDQAVWSESWAAQGMAWEPLAVGRHVRPTLDIIGPKGSIHFPGPNGEKVLSLHESNDQDKGATEQWQWEQDWGVNTSSIKSELRHFYECVREGKAPRPSPEEALMANILAEAIVESSRSGEPVYLD
ncbi:Gfo/Idh/MocA family protein [Candidatus Hydrogenedentota bacterium]